MYETREERAALFDFTGKYTEVELLNKKATGFGWAVLVEDNFESRRRKVVKLPNSESATRELLVEADILTKIVQYLRHPNLIALNSVDKYVIEWNGKKEDRWFLVLQFGGKNLRSRLGRLGLRDNQYVYLNGVPLPLDETLNLAIQLTDGLRALHEFEESPGQHIIHRDIKPENILIDDSGTARLTDFGISKVVERITQSVTAAGTAPYLAPEYSRGRLHASSDIYSLGIVLYEMAAGKFPFRSLQDRFYEMPQPPHEVNSAVPARLSDVIMQCLHWDPTAEREKEEAKRYQSAAELLADLRGCYSRLYPVPPRFEKVAGEGAATALYKDAETGKNVRIYVYNSSQPALCAARLARAECKVPKVISPDDVFESEETVGVVTALPPELRSGAAGVDLTTGEAIYGFIPQIVKLARQVEQLHRLGIYHGFLAPSHVFAEGDQWWIDQVWTGQLVGLVEIDDVLGGGGDLVGYLAPEILAWNSPPTLSSDIYGVGSILFGFLTGIPPIDPETARQMSHGAGAQVFRAVSGVRDRAEAVTRKLEAILVNALQPDPANRHRMMEELIGELDQCRWPDDMVLTLVDDARELQKHNRLMEAYDALDQALAVDPGNSAVHHARAEIFFLEGELKWALKENRRALETNPTASACFLHGQCLAAQEEYVEAEAYYRQGLERDDCSQGRHLLAKCLEKTGEHERAVQEYQYAVRIAEVIEHNTDRMQEIKADLSALLDRMKG
ncbi:MAG: serine/threonine protein kinase [Planctomycetota bacterium]|jgi:serine/threonine protein kinase